MLTNSFVLDHAHPRKDGRLALKLKIMRSRTDYVFIGLKMHYLPEQWDANRERVVNCVTAVIDNARLNNYRIAVGKIILEIDESGESLSMAEIRSRIEIAIGRRQQKPATLCAYGEAYAAKVPERRTRNSFFLTINKIRGYEEIDRAFSQITAGWLRNFEMYCRNNGLKINSISVHLRNIRTIYNRAIDDGVAQLNDYPFRRFKIRQERTRKRALTVEQVRELRDYPCTESQRQYRDIFMLILYLGGINIGDLFRLKGIENGYIYYSRSKTHRPYQIKVEPEALGIIERYRGETHLLSAADRYHNHEDFTRRINRALQSIGAPIEEKSNKSKPGPAPTAKKKGVFPGLTTYWARHTVATLMAELDVPKETIAKVLGHSDNSVTDIYIRFDQKKIDEAMRKVIDYVNG
jgi:site-specific recombinase XerD